MHGLLAVANNKQTRKAIRKRKLEKWLRKIGFSKRRAMMLVKYV